MELRKYFFYFISFVILNSVSVWGWSEGDLISSPHCVNFLKEVALNDLEGLNANPDLIRCQDDDSPSVLHKAVLESSLETVKKLILEHSFPTNLRPQRLPSRSYGRLIHIFDFSAIQYLILYNSWKDSEVLEKLQFLLESGAEIPTSNERITAGPILDEQVFKVPFLLFLKPADSRRDIRVDVILLLLQRKLLHIPTGEIYSEWKYTKRDYSRWLRVSNYIGIPNGDTFHNMFYSFLNSNHALHEKILIEHVKAVRANYPEHFDLMDSHYPMYAIQNTFFTPADMMDLGFRNSKDECVIDSTWVRGYPDYANVIEALRRNPFFLGTCASKPKGHVFKKLLHETFEKPGMEKLFFTLMSLKDTLEGSLDHETFLLFLSKQSSAKDSTLPEFFLQNGFASHLTKPQPETGVTLLHEIAGSTGAEFRNGRDNLHVFLKDPVVLQSINIADHSGLTPLHYAASNCTDQTYELLLSAGAKDLPAKNGVKPSMVYKKICGNN